MNLIYEKNSNEVVFKKLPDGSYHAAAVNGGEYQAWILVGNEPTLNTELDSIVV
jgi:hypothetical protein